MIGCGVSCHKPYEGPVDIGHGDGIWASPGSKQLGNVKRSSYESKQAIPGQTPACLPCFFQLHTWACFWFQHLAEI